MHVPPWTFFIAKYFGSGVIIATAFIHLLTPATQALQSPCLEGPITDYAWAEGIALMTVFVMFFIELMAARFDFFPHGGLEDHHALDHPHHVVGGSTPAVAASMDPARVAEEGHYSSDDGAGAAKEGRALAPAASSGGGHGPNNAEVTYPPGGHAHLDHVNSHFDGDQFAAQMTALFILEFGVIFHSIFIGLTLAVAGEEFVVLYIVLVFHQTFEGLGLGSRLATARWPRGKGWLPWVLGAAYGVSTPIAIAAGLGVRSSFEPGSQKTLIVNGVFDAISAGILLYTGLVELMAHEFMFNEGMRRSSIRVVLSAFGCMCVGAGLMALLGKWA
jgi:zinc transporter 1/2/3